VTARRQAPGQSSGEVLCLGKHDAVEILPGRDYDAELRELFSRYGEVRQANIIRDRGSGSVDMSDPSEHGIINSQTQNRTGQRP